MRQGMRALPFIFLLLQLASSFDTDVCPDEVDISPCVCQENVNNGDLNIDCNADLTLEELKQALNGLSGTKSVYLKLNKFNLGTVPSNFFYGLNIRRLDIVYCELDSLTDDGYPPLLGLDSVLEELHIYNSFNERNVPAKLRFRQHFERLKDIVISYNIITEVSDDWFDRGPPSLERLVLTNNGIEKMGSRAFANLINLKELSIDGNRFGSIQRSMLPYPAQRLETLVLDNNALTSLPEDLFTQMPSLKDISIRSNGILNLDQRTWYPIWQQVQIIRLEGNPVECSSNMNWILNTRRAIPAISGTCHSPPEVEGESIEDFIKRRSRVK